MMLYRKNDAALDFDFAKVSEQSRDNPVFYVQYAHARGALDLPQCPRDGSRIFPTMTPTRAGRAGGRRISTGSTIPPNSR